MVCLFFLVYSSKNRISAKIFSKQRLNIQIFIPGFSFFHWRNFCCLVAYWDREKGFLGNFSLVSFILFPRRGSCKQGEHTRRLKCLLPEKHEARPHSSAGPILKSSRRHCLAAGPELAAVPCWRRVHGWPWVLSLQLLPLRGSRPHGSKRWFLSLGTFWSLLTEAYRGNPLQTKAFVLFTWEYTVF